MVFTTLYHLLRSLRPRQWFKNLSLFAALVFAGRFFDRESLIVNAVAFLIFCGISSAMYLVNDLVDAPKDRLHPFKKNRPIASGSLSTTLAVIAVMIILLIFIPAAWFVNKYFFIMSIAFIFLQISYSFYFRNVIIMDALIVASAFVLRVYAGAAAISESISSWLALTTIGLSLLLAFGKRRSERTLIEGIGGKTNTRTTLQHYPDALLDAMIAMSASFAVISYSIFTFQTPRGSLFFLKGYIPQALAEPKLMMFTIPLVIYGVARYLYVIYEKKEGESPERVLLSDYPLLGTVLLWSLTIFIIIYSGS